MVKKKETIKIKNRFTDKVIFESTKTNLREAVLEAIEKKADLSEADLSEADLSEADLSEANLSKADLSKADLSEAYYWATNFKYNKVTKKTKEKIIELFHFKDVKE